MGLAILIAIIAEITSVVLVADWLGGLFTLALLALACGVGLAVLAGRGLATVTNASQAMQRGETVAAPLADGALLAFAGVLLIIPGFVTDAAALLLLVPFVRGAVVSSLVRRVKAHVVTVVGPVNSDAPGDVIDTTATEVRRGHPELP
jgi:UPF0716 protein FxsA